VPGASASNAAPGRVETPLPGPRTERNGRLSQRRVNGRGDGSVEIHLERERACPYQTEGQGSQTPELSAVRADWSASTRHLENRETSRRCQLARRSLDTVRPPHPSETEDGRLASTSSRAVETQRTGKLQERTFLWLSGHGCLGARAGEAY